MTKRTAFTALSAACAAVLFGGCAQQPSLTDRDFGDTVRAAVAQQTANPDAPAKRAALGGIDGPAAKSTIDRYEKSYDTPPAPVNVFTIGVTGSASGGGSR